MTRSPLTSLILRKTKQYFGGSDKICFPIVNLNTFSHSSQNLAMFIICGVKLEDTMFSCMQHASFPLEIGMYIICEEIW